MIGLIILGILSLFIIVYSIWLWHLNWSVRPNLDYSDPLLICTGNTIQVGKDGIPCKFTNKVVCNSSACWLANDKFVVCWFDPEDEGKGTAVTANMVCGMPIFNEEVAFENTQT